MGTRNWVDSEESDTEWQTETHHGKPVRSILVVSLVGTAFRVVVAILRAFDGFDRGHLLKEIRPVAQHVSDSGDSVCYRVACGTLTSVSTLR